MKPKPPADLWERLSEIASEMGITRPPNTFTASEYADHYKVARSQAHSTLSRLEKLGKVEKIQLPGAGRIYWRMA